MTSRISSPISFQRRTFLASAASVAAAVVAPAFTHAAGPAVQAATLPDFGAAPEFTGIERWLNSEPLIMDQLRGRVVLVDFWTYACINCIRTLPHVNRWAELYTPQGLTVVGVHTPEFPFERTTSNVEVAMRRHGVKHPVAQDNRYGTWKAYSNQYWPAAYLIDAQGRIRYKHFGEGEYERTEAVIRALLAARS
ncbi:MULTISPECIES: thioredoxin family protein [Acidovorax]|uniref:Thioredoxin family protein n=1 Tax=Acidovorax facilis TaxID=12917 RepID=A0ABV8DB97_9BURK|nr:MULTISPECIES: thioredoxin family protein [Acidovorax]KQB56741.1 thioredoxin [Acidovorax sp. SD340]MBO1008559.1 thioredoxin family protein [Acidovorax sp. SD340]MCO4242557.1 thioredoxin family protein [Acidovorax facilis]